MENEPVFMESRFERITVTDIHTHVQPDHVIEYIKTLVEDENIHKFITTEEIEITFEDNEHSSRKKITIVMDKRLYRRINRAALIETLRKFERTVTLQTIASLRL